MMEERKGWREGEREGVLYTSVLRRNTRVVHLVYMIRNNQTEIESTRERVVQCVR